MQSIVRKLTPYEYFQILQIEWLVADLRSRIYPSGKDKDYWIRVKEGKQRRFDEIATKNQLPTILTDDEMKQYLELQIYKENGIPDFKYRDDEQRQSQEPFDLAYYYNKDTQVRFNYLSDQKMGKVKSYLPYKETIVIISEEQEYTVNIKEVTRIL